MRCGLRTTNVQCHKDVHIRGVFDLTLSSCFDHVYDAGVFCKNEDFALVGIKDLELYRNHEILKCYNICVLNSMYDVSKRCYTCLFERCMIPPGGLKKLQLASASPRDSRSSSA